MTSHSRADVDPTRWTTGGTQLQKPDWVFFGGELRRWEDAVLHVSTEAVIRGLNVFEGLKGYWQADGSFGFVNLEQHFTRLNASASLLHIPQELTYEEFRDACLELARVLIRPESDLYVRATLFVVEGHYGLGTRADLVLTGYQQRKDPPSPIAIGVSTWRRAADVVMPPRIKTGTNYQIARLARIEGRGRGYEDMILLNEAGRVAESTGACVVVVRGGRVFTPPATEGALESITLEIVTQLAGQLGIELVTRPVDRTELYIAEELGLVGTLVEVTPVAALDEYVLPENASVLSALLARYRAAVTGADPHPVVALSTVPR